MILGGKVRVGDEVADKPGRQVPEDCVLTVIQDRNPYASRGGLKLEHALKTFSLSLSKKTALDIGASTGGFTDCLLQHGVAKVYAVDVGYGQLDWKVQSDPRVVILDRKNARTLTLDDLKKADTSHCDSSTSFSGPVDLVVIDVSFISLKQVIPPALSLLKPEGDIIALVKPQFEVEKEEVEHQGIIKSPEKHLKVLLALRAFLQAQGWVLHNLVASPIMGLKGNKEFLIHCTSPQRGAALGEEIIREMVLADNKRH